MIVYPGLPTVAAGDTLIGIIIHIIGGLTMNTNTQTTQTTETTYVIDGQIVSKAQYEMWLDIRRGGSGF